jgi:hypothetical protein
LKKNILKKCKKNDFEKMSIFGLFGKTDFGPPGGRVNIMADGNFLATYLKIGLDYEFNIKNNI